MAKSDCSAQSGRSPGFRIIALPAPSRHFWQWLKRGANRLQWRLRSGFSPLSLLCSLDERHQAELALLWGRCYQCPSMFVNKAGLAGKTYD